MTAQEAIKLLHPDTTKEAIAEIKYYCGFHGKEAAMKAIEEACLLACDTLEKEAEITRGYIHNQNLEWDLLSFADRKEKERRNAGNID